MNDREIERFEAELRRLKPAAPPAGLMSGLRQAGLGNPSHLEPAGEAAAEPVAPAWLVLWRWLAPASALMLAGLAVGHWRASNSSSPVPAASVKAQDVSINRELISTFDAVSKLPTGEPVRFRCRQWVDEVVLRDPASGVVIAQRTPRVEVVPVRFETY